MQILGMFRRYLPEPEPEVPAAYFVNETGIDWYSIVHDAERVKDNIYIGTSDTGQIVDIADDGTTMHPEGKIVYELARDDFPEWVMDKRLYTRIIDNEFTVDYEKMNLDTQYRYIAKARKVSKDWETELILKIISDEDKENLKSVMLYMQKLRAVDITQPDPDWPPEPDFMN